MLAKPFRQGEVSYLTKVVLVTQPEMWAIQPEASQAELC